MANSASEGAFAATAWRNAPATISPLPGALDLWRANLDQDAATRRLLSAALSVDEQARAARFRFPKDEIRFTTARGILRDILARYSGEPAARLEFGYGPRGKPFLVSRDEVLRLEFNVSHSAMTAVYGVARKWAVGVDVERIRPDFDCDRLAGRFFTPREAAALGALAPPEKARAFFRCWTRKEAYVKAIGEGLRSGLRNCEVSLETGDEDALLEVLGDPAAPSRWRVGDIAAGDEFAAAFAVGRVIVERRFFDWTEPLR